MKKGKFFVFIIGFIVLGGVIYGITTFFSGEMKVKVENQTFDNKHETIVKNQLKKDEEYIQKKHEEFQNLHNEVQAYDFLNENLKNDGPEFTITMQYIQEIRSQYETIIGEIETYFNEATIQERGKELKVSEESSKLYEEEYEKAFLTLKSGFSSNLPGQLKALEDIFTFLKQKQDGWAIQEKGLLFDKQEDMEEYKRLLENLSQVAGEDRT